MGKSKSSNVQSLFQEAHDQGNLSMASMQALDVVDIGAQIQDALGVPADDVASSEVFLVTIDVDDSGSIRFVTGNTEAVRDGHNGVLDALLKSKQKSGILAHSRYINGELLYPYCPLDKAVRLDTHNYNPGGGTPLRDSIVETLGIVLAKSQEFARNGVPVRTGTLIVTDGNDEGSWKANPSSVRSVVTDMLKAETHIIAAMGIDDGHTDFRAVFQEFGIPDQWILTPKNTPSEIRKAFVVFSQSAVRASQNAASFSKTALGGFGV